METRWLHCARICDALSMVLESFSKLYRLAHKHWPCRAMQMDPVPVSGLRFKPVSGSRTLQIYWRHGR